jgi:hypothetical protein
MIATRAGYCISWGLWIIQCDTLLVIEFGHSDGSRPGPPSRNACCCWTLILRPLTLYARDVAAVSPLHFLAGMAGLVNRASYPTIHQEV